MLTEKVKKTRDLSSVMEDAILMDYSAGSTVKEISSTRGVTQKAIREFLQGSGLLSTSSLTRKARTATVSIEDVDMVEVISSVERIGLVKTAKVFNLRMTVLRDTLIARGIEITRGRPKR